MATNTVVPDPVPDRNFAWVAVQAEGTDVLSSASRVWKQYSDRPFDTDALKKAVKVEFAPRLDLVPAPTSKSTPAMRSRSKICWFTRLLLEQLTTILWSSCIHHYHQVLLGLPLAYRSASSSAAHAHGRSQARGRSRVCGWIWWGDLVLREGFGVGMVMVVRAVRVVVRTDLA
eukprot:1562201-Rhodomonas_salina.1